MTISSFFKNMFGVGTANDEADSVLYDTPSAYNESEDAAADAAARQSDAVHSAEGVVAGQVDTARLQSIFDGVIEIFNREQPEFVRRSLSTEEQRRYIYDNLEQSLKDYLRDLSEATSRECRERLKGEKNALNAEVERLRQSSDQLRQQREEIKQQQLSTERQKKALADRLHDLEAQVADLEARHEQDDLVNRGLLNKLKVASLQGGNTEEGEEVLKQLEELREQSTALSEENASLKEQLAVSADKVEMADHMADDLRRRAAESREACEKAEKKLAEAVAQTESARAELESACVARDKALADLEKKEKELAEAVVAQSQIDAIMKQMETVSDILDKRDMKIKQLRERVTELEAELSATKAEKSAPAESEEKAEHTPSRIETIITFDDIDAPAPEVEEPAAIFGDDKQEQAKKPEPARRPRGRSSSTERPMISDSDLADIDRSFGYHAPKKTYVEESDAQMSFNFD